MDEAGATQALEFRPCQDADDEVESAFEVESAEEADGADDTSPRWLRDLRSAARDSKLKSSQYHPFLAAVELDEARPRDHRLGMRALFEACVQMGRPWWLDPARALFPLSDALQKFEGPGVSLRFVVHQCIRLAREGVSPEAFVRHVVLPRMEEDHDWRRWRERHRDALAEIVDLLCSLRKDPPFDGERLGTTEVLSDVALCKFVGRPLALMAAGRLADYRAQIHAYGMAWRSFKFRSRFFLLFLRRNVLPFTYRMAGLVEPAILRSIVESCAALEPALSARLDALLPATASRIVDDSSLWGNFDLILENRRALGEPWIAFVRELSGYLSLARALAATNSGLALLGWFAQFLRLPGDGRYAHDAAAMIASLRDPGGLSAILWHAKRLRELETGKERDAFIASIAEAGGLAPDYPFRARMDPLEAAEAERLSAASRLARSLGLEEALRARLAEKKQKQASMKLLLETWRSSKPEREALAKRFFRSVEEGRERSWTDDDLAAFDAQGQAAHELLMRALVRGLGSGFSPFALKTTDLKSLREAWGEADRLSLPDISVPFSLGEGEDRDEASLDSAARDEFRKKINMDFISDCLATLKGVDFEGSDESYHEAEAYAALGQLGILARKAVEEMERSLQLLEADPASAPAALQKARHQAVAAKARLSIFDRLFNLRTGASSAVRFALCLHAASHLSKPQDEPCRAVFAWAARRWANEDLRRRIRWLSEDVAEGFLTLEQLGTLVDSVEFLCDLAARDQALIQVFESAQGGLLSFLSSTSPLAGGRVAAECASAGLRKAAGAARLQAERTKWKELVDRGQREAARERHYTFRMSKSFLDAYHGDYGGSCLASHPQLILRPGFYPIRLWDHEEEQVAGVGSVALVIPRVPPLHGGTRYWMAFAFNPLPSVARRWNARQMLTVYLSWRLVLEKLSRESGLPVFLGGIAGTGAMTNNLSFQNLIINYERSRHSLEVRDARGLDILYPEEVFAHAFLLADPESGQGFIAAGELEKLGAT